MGVSKRQPPKEKSGGGGTKARSTGAKTRGSQPWEFDVASGTKVRSSAALPQELRMREFILGIAALAKLGDEFTGLVLENKAEELAYGWAKLGQEDARVARVLKMMFEGSAWAEAVIPTAGVLLVISWHYGILVPDRIGVPLTMAQGVYPKSREVEVKEREAAAAEARQAAAAAEAEGGSGAHPDS